jgi:hypothetical protein
MVGHDQLALIVQYAPNALIAMIAHRAQRSQLVPACTISQSVLKNLTVRQSLTASMLLPALRNQSAIHLATRGAQKG